MACGDLPRRTGNKHWTALLLLLALLLPLATAAYDVCDAPKDCHQLSEGELGNVDISTFISALPGCMFACITPAGIDIPALHAAMKLPDCQPMSQLVTCTVDTCGQEAIDRTTFCLLQDVLRNACQEDFDAGVTYEDGGAPIVDL
jgi:hypothetical protein